MTIFLNRHTGFDRNCRVRFNMRVGKKNVQPKGPSTCDIRFLGKQVAQYAEKIVNKVAKPFNKTYTG